MKNCFLILAIIASTTPASISAATQAVEVNPDGSFSPSMTFIARGDTVKWTLSGPADSIIPVTWDGASAGFCSAVKPFSATDPNDLTGPMPQAASNPADTDSTLQNALINSQGVFVELYEERFWEAVRQPNGIIDPLGSGRTMAQWSNEFQSRRRQKSEIGDSLSAFCFLLSAFRITRRS